jgi:hypothetical protein
LGSSLYILWLRKGSQITVDVSAIDSQVYNA